MNFAPFCCPGFKALHAAASAALRQDSPAAFAVADKAATLLGDLATEGLALPRSACGLVADVLRASPPTRKVDRPLRAALACASQCGVDWRDVDDLGADLATLKRDLAANSDLDADYKTDLATAADDLSRAIDAALPQDRPTPEDDAPGDSVSDLLPQALIARLVAAAQNRPDAAEL